MKVIYTGRHGAVDLPLPDGTEPTVKWGDVIDVPADFAASLLEQQDNWAAAPAAAKPKAEKASEKEGVAE